MKRLSDRKIKELTQAGIRLGCRTCKQERAPGAMRTETRCERCEHEEKIRLRRK